MLLSATMVAVALPGCSHPSAAIAPAADATASAAVVSSSYENVATSIAPTVYDLDAFAKSLPPGLDAALAAARDKISGSSYSGVLLGGSGAYRNRSANSVDRSLMLAHILRDENVTTRFATCSLDAKSAETLAQQLFVPARAAAAASPAAPDAFTARVLARGDRDFQAVRDALGSSVPSGAVPHDKLIAELQDHTWLQAQSGGKWVDLDPSFPDAAVGRSYCTPSATPDAPPDSELQKVSVRVGFETLGADGTLTETVVLDQTMPAYSVLDRQVYLMHSSGNGAMSVFADRAQVVPILNVDGNIVSGTPFRMADGPAGNSSKLSQGISQIFAGPTTSADAGATATPNPGPFFVGEWLELGVTLPNGQKDSTRRFIYDRAGAAWRASQTHDPSKLAALASNDDGPLAAQGVHEICYDAGAHDLRAFGAAMAAANAAEAAAEAASPAPSAAASGGAAAQPNLTAALWPFGLHNIAFGILSDRRVLPQLATDPGIRYYADSPRIFVFGMGPNPANPSTFYTDSDLRRDTVRGIAQDPSKSDAVAQGLLRFGVLEGALEEEAMAPPASMVAAGATIGSTSDLLDGSGVTVLRPGADLGGIADPETAARAKAALDAGSTLVVPNEVLKGGPSGWWEVAKDGSSTRAVYGDGYGGTQTFFGGTVSGPQYGGQLVTHIDPATGNSYMTRGGQLVDMGGYKPPPTTAAAGGGNEYSTTLIIVIIAAAGFAILGAIMAYYFLVKKPYLEATYGPGTAPL